MKKCIAVIAAVIFIIISFSGAAFAADSSVSFEGGAEKFVFLPGSDYSDTDLFPGFKNVMPGDVLEQEITVRNDSKQFPSVNIYLRAEVIDSSDSIDDETAATMTDFLSQLQLDVYNGSQHIYSGSPDITDGLTNDVLLGTFPKGSEKTLIAKLTVPKDLDNKYEYREGIVKWIFTVTADDPTSPLTADDHDTLTWLIIALLAAAVLLAVSAARVKK